MVDYIVFPSSFFDGTKVDEDLQKEYDAVIESGLFQIGIFNYDKWFNEDKLVVNNIPEQMHDAIYRGWMMNPSQYNNFYNLLVKKNIRLITKPEQYELMHIFPNAYNLIKEDTPKIEVYKLHEHININELKKEFKRFMVKDYVKSVKGTKFPKYFDQTTAQEDFDNWMKVFYNYRGELLTGGICIKEFVDLKKYNGNTNEYRVFYMNGKVCTVCKNSDQEETLPNPPIELINKYKDINSPYYTIDYAELEDGRWIIIEVGDGQVSGLPMLQDNETYYKILYDSFK